MASIQILHRERFRNVLLEQRDHANRNGPHFALAILDLRSTTSSAHGDVPITSEITHHLSEDQRVGWIDRGILGIAFPDAKPEETDELLLKLPDGAAKVPCKMHFCCSTRQPSSLNGSTRVDAYDLGPFFFRPTPLWKRSFDVTFSAVMLVKKPQRTQHVRED